MIGLVVAVPVRVPRRPAREDTNGTRHMSDHISHIAASETGNLFVTAAFEHHLTIWSLVDKRKVTEFDSIMDFGGRRLAVSNGEAPVVIAAAYYKHGIAAYTCNTGKELWRRKDLKKCQTLRVISDTHAMASFEGANCEVIRLSDGKSHKGPRGIDGIEGTDTKGRVIVSTKVRHAGPDESRICLWRNGTMGFEWKSPPAIRAVHTGAASPRQTIVTDMNGEAAAYDHSGNQLWRHRYGRIVKLAWVSGTDFFAGAIYPDKSGECLRLCVFNHNGSVVHTHSLEGVAVEAFSGDGKYFFTGKGEVRALPTMDLVWRFR